MGVNCYFGGRADPFMNGLGFETWVDLQSEMNQRACRINAGSVTERYYGFFFFFFPIVQKIFGSFLCVAFNLR